MQLAKNLVLFSVLITSTFVSANPIGLQDINPVVIASSPVAGTTQVDPSTTEITVQFSKSMMTNKMWSVVQVKNVKFPTITDDVYFKQDKRTFVIPVKLQANTVYAISINSSNRTGFKDLQGNAAKPYIVSFQTQNQK